MTTTAARNLGSRLARRSPGLARVSLAPGLDYVCRLLLDSVFASGGCELGLRPETIDALMAPAIPARRGFFDECFRGPVQFSLGFMKPSETFRFGHPGAFGAPGAGGSMGYADPQEGIGYGYVTNRMGLHLEGDPRDVALRTAIPTGVRRPSPAPRHSGGPQPHG